MDQFIELFEKLDCHLLQVTTLLETSASVKKKFGTVNRHKELIKNSLSQQIDALDETMKDIFVDFKAEGIQAHLVEMESSLVNCLTAVTYTDAVIEIDKYGPPTFTTPITAVAAQVCAQLHEDYAGNPWLIVLWHD
jgi:hypothetical protein